MSVENAFTSADGVLVQTSSSGVKDRQRLAGVLFDELEVYQPGMARRFMKVAGRMEKEAGIDGALAFMGLYTVNFSKGRA